MQVGSAAEKPPNGVAAQWMWPVSRCHLFGAGFGRLRWSDMQAILGEQLGGLLCVEFSTLPLLLDW